MPLAELLIRGIWYVYCCVATFGHVEVGRMEKAVEGLEKLLEIEYEIIATLLEKLPTAYHSAEQVNTVDEGMQFLSKKKVYKVDTSPR